VTDVSPTTVDPRIVAPPDVAQVPEQDTAQDTTLAEPPRLTVAEPSASTRPALSMVAPLIALAIMLTLITAGFSLRGRLTRVD
jgi:hypothetical protein